MEITLLATNIKAMAKKFALQCNTIYQIGIVFDRLYIGMAAELPLLECWPFLYCQQHNELHLLFFVQTWKGGRFKVAS